MLGGQDCPIRFQTAAEALTTSTFDYLMITALDISKICMLPVKHQYSHRYAASDRMQFSRIRIPRVRFFPIFYSGTFTLFAFLLFALLLVTPGDHIYQSMKAGELYRIIIVGGVYVLTFVVALFIYAARLFSTRSALANIPRAWDLSGNETDNPSLGIGMSGKMGRLVREGWQRSAVITYECTPRELKGRSQIQHATRQSWNGGQLAQQDLQEVIGNTSEPTWGTVRHPGWSDPESLDLPNLHFGSVIAELPNLLEAKAVSLGSTITPQQAMEEDQSSTDLAMIEILRRPLYMGLRDYLEHLHSLDILGSELPLCGEFLDLYETARFSGNPLEEDEFRHLMSLFSDMMRGMEHLDERQRAKLVAHSDAAEGTRRSSGASDGTTRHHKLPREQDSEESMGSRSEAQATAYTAPSRFRYSRNISDVSVPTTATSGYDDMQEPRLETMETRSQLSSASVESSSLASSGGSVIRTGRSPSQLNIPLVRDDNSMSSE